MTDKEYRASPGVSRSELFWITESPEKFRFYRENPQPPTPALLFGQLFHAMALEPDTMWEQFAVAPMVDRRTKVGKEAVAQFAQEASDKTVVTMEMVEQAAEMCEALGRNKYARRLLEGEHEKPVFWTDEMTGEACKCRLDCLSKIGDDLAVVDLKTADSAETEVFTRAAIKYGYDLQAAMYSEGVKVSTGRTPLFVFVVIEKNPPYSINILQADKLFIQRGYDLFRELIGIYSDCTKTGNWYGYLGKFDQINNLALPAWLAKEVE